MGICSGLQMDSSAGKTTHGKKQSNGVSDSFDKTSARVFRCWLLIWSALIIIHERKFFSIFLGISLISSDTSFKSVQLVLQILLLFN